MTTQSKEPLLRMAKRDSISPRAAWGIRAVAFLLALITGGLLLLSLGHNPLTVYRAMITGAWGSPTVARETVKIAVPLLITSIGISLGIIISSPALPRKPPGLVSRRSRRFCPRTGRSRLFRQLSLYIELRPLRDIGAGSPSRRPWLRIRRC